MHDEQEPQEETDEQIEALNRLARQEAGALVDGPTPEEKPKKPRKTGKEAPQIELPGEGRRITDFAREAALAVASRGIYSRSEMPVVVSEESGQITALTPERFCTELEESAVTCVTKVIKAGGEEIIIKKPKTMTPTIAKVTLAAPAFIRGLKPLLRVNMVQQPIMREDGRMEMLPIGHDEESGILTLRSGVEIASRGSIEALNEKDRKIAKKMAVETLRRELSEFPMVSPLDLSIHASAMISYYGALLMRANALRLNYFYKANKHRSGKTLLIKTVVSPVMGRTVIQPFPKNEDRMIELLNSVALSGKPYLVIDDVKGYLSSEALNGFITSSWWGGRRFHRQELFECERQAICFLSGHEVTLSPDLAGRFLECRLHVEEADANRHRVKNPIDDSYLERKSVRSELLNALNTLITLWDLAGRPRSRGERPGFQEWCRIYGGITEWAGFGDPCELRGDDEGSDPELDDMKAMLRALVSQMEPTDRLKEFSFSDLIEACLEHGAFSWAIEGKWEREEGERWYKPSKRTESKLGWMWGQKYGGTTFAMPDGRRVRFGRQGKNRQRRYLVERLD